MTPRRQIEMKLHYLQHVPFEGPANLQTWAKENGHTISGTPLYDSQKFPVLSDFDWLIVMGGPMSIYEDDRYPWLTPEKKLIEQAITHRKIVLGICLGAQLIAAVLGSKVYRNQYQEIGWFPVTLTPAATQSPAFAGFPRQFTAFHWHGDTFNPPSGSIRIGGSAACPNQAFQYNDRVIGLQFHLESSFESISLLMQNCGDELVEGKYIQKPGLILPQENYLLEIYRTMNLLLNNMAEIQLKIDN
jgi:GMP synthase-like glutamine amidotransferase